jgi:hypothetical protein
MLGLDIHVTEPHELVEQVALLGERYRRALPQHSAKLPHGRESLA